MACLRDVICAACADQQAPKRVCHRTAAARRGTMQVVPLGTVGARTAHYTARLHGVTMMITRLASCVRWVLLLLLAAARAAQAAGRAAAQDPQRRAHRQRWAALAGDLHRRRPDAAEREARRHLGQGGGPEARVLARRRERAAQGAVPVPVDHGRRARPDLRQPGQGQHRPGDQRARLLLPRLQRDDDRAPGPAHQLQRVRPEPQHLRVRVAERTAGAARAGSGIYGTWATFKDIFNVTRSQLPLHVGCDLPYAGQLEPASRRCSIASSQTTTQLDDEAVYDAFMQVPLLDSFAQQPAAGAVRGLRRDGQLGARGALRPGAAQRARLRPVRRGAVEHAAGTAGVQGPDDVHHHHRPRPRQRAHASGRSTASRRRARRTSGSRSWVRTPRRSASAATYAEVHQAQIAATVAAFLGKDYRQGVPQAAPPLPEVLGSTPYVTTRVRDDHPSRRWHAGCRVRRALRSAPRPPRHRGPRPCSSSAAPASSGRT